MHAKVTRGAGFITGLFYACELSIALVSVVIRM